MDSKQILILGAKGMLGQALVQAFVNAQPVCWDRQDLDITDETAVRAKIGALRPGIIINAAGYTDVDGAEANEELATRINGGAVGYLAAVAKSIGAILAHYSTDYVFDGGHKAGYLEDAVPNPVNAYGRSKLAGEQALAASGAAYYLIRTSWLYGPGGKNFVGTILTKAAADGKLKVVSDQYGRPTYTVDLAEKTKEILGQRLPFGIYHATNSVRSGKINWYDLARQAVALRKVEAVVVPCSSAEFPRPARRPMYAVLLNTKLRALPDWDEALARYLNAGKL